MPDMARAGLSDLTTICLASHFAIVCLLCATHYDLGVLLAVQASHLNVIDCSIIGYIFIFSVLWFILIYYVLLHRLPI